MNNKRQLVHHSIYLALLLMLFGILIFGAKQLSLTSDEPPHIAHGYVMLKTGDTWALSAHRHPPLINMLSALPLLWQPEQPDPRQIDAWNGDFILFVRALWPLLGRLDRLAYVTRFPNILLSIILIAIVIRWMREITGLSIAVITAVMLALDPTYIAHSQLNTTDIGLAFFVVLCHYLIHRCTIPSECRRDYPRIILFGLAIGVTLGCALATKASGLLLVPVIYGLLFWRTVRQKKNDAEVSFTIQISSVVQWFIVSACITASAILTVVAVYAIPRLLQSDFNIFPSVVAHLDLISLTLSERYRSAFLGGEIRQGGWWYYFPYAFGLKTPIPTLLLLTGTLFYLLRHPKRIVRRIELWLFPFIYIASAIRSNMNIGLRHLLPAFPFIFMSIGFYVQHLFKLSISETKSRSHHLATKKILSLVLKPILVLLLLWQAVALVAVYPFPIAFFNVFAGGPKQGYRYLVDSNVDWGQSFLALKKYLQAENINSPYLSYYTWIDPAAYGINYQPLPPNTAINNLLSPFNPEPGIYAISATTLQGVMMPEPNLYDWFRHREPSAQPGYGLLVYKVEPQYPPSQWVAQCIKPISPLSHNEIVSGFGIESMREIYFDCTEAWIYPRPQDGPGWYVIHMETIHQKNRFVERFLSPSRLSYQQLEPGRLPAFAIYEYDLKGSPTLSSALASFGANELSLTDYAIADQPSADATNLEIYTTWTVLSAPNRPLSFMLHLIDRQTGTTLVGDALSVPVTEWREGDTIIQRHQFLLSKDNQNKLYDVAVGVYWLDTLNRWPAESQLQIDNDAVVITQVKVD